MAQGPLSNFPNSISCGSPFGPLSLVANSIDPEKWYVYCDNFLPVRTADWTETKVGAGAGLVVTPATNVGAGGTAVIVTGASQGDGSSLQMVSNGFTPVVGKKMLFATRFKVDSASLTVVGVGLVNTDTTPLSHTEGIFIQKASGALTWSLDVTTSSTATTTASLGSLVDNQFTIIALYYDGSTVQAFQDLGSGAGIQLIGSSVATNLPLGNLRVTLHTEAGTAVARTGTYDWVYCAGER